MQHLRTYDSLAKAEIDRGLLNANGVQAALEGSDSATLGDALRPEIRLSVREDRHALALAILADEERRPAEEVQARHDALTDHERFAVVLIRTLGLFMMVGGLIYLTYIGENMTRIAGERIELVNPIRARVILGDRAAGLPPRRRWSPGRLRRTAGAVGVLGPRPRAAPGRMKPYPEHPAASAARPRTWQDASGPGDPGMGLP